MISTAQIRMVKAAQRRLLEQGVDEDTFREIMQQETGVRSTKLIPDNSALNRLIRRIEKFGFVNSSAKRPRRKVRHSPNDPITEEQRWKIAQNYEAMGYDTEERRQGFNVRQCGKLPWGAPQTVLHGQKIIQGQEAILARATAVSGSRK